jgi:dihydrodipicolinate synthase/N-acetylneuraminate lyase
MKFEGIICPMISPFTVDGRIYADGVRNLIEFLRKNSVNGIFVYGAYGLGPAMSIDERKKIAELSVEHASGKMDVIIHVGSSNIDTSIELAKHAEDIGADAVASTPPFYYRYDDDAVYSFFRSLIKKVNIPVFVYNIPPRVGYGITPSLLKRIADEGACGIKDTSGDIILFYQFIMTIRNRDFKFLVGTERLMLPSMIAGGHGCVAGLSNAFPEIIVEFYKMLKEGRYKEAVERQFFIIELRDIMYSVPNIPATYAVLKLRGIDVGYPKPPHKPLSNEELEKLKLKLTEKNLL